MLGFGKKKVEIKTVEDFIKGEGGKPAETALPTEEKNIVRQPAFTKLKPFIAPFVGFFVVLILAIAAFAKIGALTAEVSDLKAQITAGEVNALRSQVSTLTGQMEKNAKMTEQLRSEVAKLEREIEAEKTQRARAETAKKQAAANAGKKKKQTPTPPRRRT